MVSFNWLSLIIAPFVFIGGFCKSTDLLGSFGTFSDQNGLSTHSSLPEERIAVNSFILAYINYTYTNSDGNLVHFSAEKGKYGEGRVLIVQGLLVHVTSETDTDEHTACTPLIQGTNGNKFPAAGTWIALVKRGDCSFEEKVKHVWLHKALGVIVYNDRDTNVLDKMRIIDEERNITAVFTDKWLGEKLAGLVDNGNAIFVSLSPSRYAKPMQNINRTSVLFVSISFIVLMIISLIWLVFYYVQRFRYLQTKDRKTRQLSNVAKRIIAKIPVKNVKSDDKITESDCCAICIEVYKTSDVIRVLPCNHEFHKICIDPWLLEHRTCPMCKMDILKHYGFVVGAKLNKSNSNFVDVEHNLPSPVITENSSNTASNTSNEINDSLSVNNSFQSDRLNHTADNLSSLNAARNNRLRRIADV